MFLSRGSVLIIADQGDHCEKQSASPQEIVCSERFWRKQNEIGHIILYFVSLLSSFSLPDFKITLTVLDGWNN